MPQTRLAKNIGLVLTSIFITLLIFELLARIAIGPPVALKLTKAQRDVQTSFDVTYSVDKAGRRLTCSDSSAPSGQPQAVFVGDSFVFGQAVPDKTDFVALLSCRFPAVQFINYGAIGRGLSHYNAVVDAFVSKETDWVFIILFENDVPETGFGNLGQKIKRFMASKTHLTSLYYAAKRSYSSRQNTEQIIMINGRKNNPASVARKSPDFLKRWTYPTSDQLEVFRREVKALITKANKLAPQARVVLAMIPEASTVSKRTRRFYESVQVGFLPEFGAKSATYVAAQELCESDCVFIDVFESFAARGDEFYLEKDFHWTEAGHANMADQLPSFFEAAQ